MSTFGAQVPNVKYTYRGEREGDTAFFKEINNVNCNQNFLAKFISLLGRKGKGIMILA
jgi:hypothetical protein